MRRVIRLLSYMLIFLVAGEAVVRFDRNTLFFQGRGTGITDSRPSHSPLLAKIDADNFRPARDQYRVMVIGDSYLHGLGMGQEQRFSSRLSEKLRARCGDEVLVLDLTVAGYNNYMNTKKFFEYVDLFQPHDVVWGYMINDVYGRFGEKAAPGRATPARVDDLSARDRMRKVLDAVQSWTYAHLKVIQYILPLIGNELKTRGLVVPGSQFHHEVTRSHDEAFAGWRKSSALLDQVMAACRERDIALILLIDPMLNMLEHYSVLDATETSIRDFFASRGVTVLRGAAWFPTAPPLTYAVSRYDGHPNADAHEILANNIAERLDCEEDATNAQ